MFQNGSSYADRWIDEMVCDRRLYYVSLCLCFRTLHACFLNIFVDVFVYEQKSLFVCLTPFIDREAMKIMQET